VTARAAKVSSIAPRQGPEALVIAALSYLDQARSEGGSRGALGAEEQAYQQFRLKTERREHALLRLASAGAAAESPMGLLDGSIASLNRILPLLERRLGDDYQVSTLRTPMNLVGQQLDALEQLGEGKHREAIQVDLRSIAQDALTVYAPLFASTSVEATLVGASRVVIHANRSALLQRCYTSLEWHRRVAGMTRNRWVELEVVPGNPAIIFRDSGNGVPVDRRELMFDPFFTTREGGDGLGLYFARTLMRSNGHDIHVSENGDEVRLVFRPVSSRAARHDGSSRSDGSSVAGAGDAIQSDR
jgi:signal transduction histidine kinase